MRQKQNSTRKNCFRYLGQMSRYTKITTVRDTPPYGYVPTYQMPLTYLERQKSYGPEKLAEKKRKKKRKRWKKKNSD